MCFHTIHTFPHLCLLEVLEETKLLRHKQQQGPAPPLLAPGRPPHAMNVLLGVIRGVKLDDPVHGCAQGGGST